MLVKFLQIQHMMCFKKFGTHTCNILILFSTKFSELPHYCCWYFGKQIESTSKNLGRLQRDENKRQSVPKWITLLLLIKSPLHSFHMSIYLFHILWLPWNHINSKTIFRAAPGSECTCWDEDIFHVDSKLTFPGALKDDFFLVQLFPLSQVVKNH